MDEMLRTQVSEGYFIEDRFIQWGETLTDIDTSLKDIDHTVSHNGWSNIKLRCNTILNLACINCEISAPKPTKPILHVSYDLSSQDSLQNNKYEYWTVPLTNLLGPPQEANNLANDEYSSLAYEMIWIIDNVKIGITVFNEVREVNGSASGAILYCMYMNEVALAKSILDITIEKDKLLFEQTDKPTHFECFTIEEIEPYYIPDYSSDTPHLGLTNDLLRKSQRALYTNDLLETPSFIKSQLKDSQFIIWQYAINKKWAISTLWDTVLIDDTPIALYNILPAKGGGYMVLEVGELSLTSKHSSPTLKKAFALLENIEGKKLPYHESYDC